MKGFSLKVIEFFQKEVLVSKCLLPCINEETCPFLSISVQLLDLVSHVLKLFNVDFLVQMADNCNSVLEHSKDECISHGALNGDSLLLEKH